MGFLGAIGSVLGSVAGPLIGGLFGGSKSVTGTPAGVTAVSSPAADKAVSIINSLLSQTPTFSTQYSNIMNNYINRAEASFEHLPQTIRDYGFTARSNIDSLYDRLFSSMQNVYNTEWEKSRQALGLSGMLNTPALLQTQTDLMNNLQYNILSKKTADDVSIEKSIFSDLVRIATSQPDFYSNLGKMKIETDPTLKQFDVKLGLAKTLMGVPYHFVNTPAQPGLLPSIIQGLGSVPTSTWSEIGRGISDIFSSIFRR